MIDSNDLYHSKGPWKKHKYLRKFNGRYIYKVAKRKIKNFFSKAKDFCKKYFDKALNTLASSAVQFGFNMLDGILNYNMYVYDANGNIVGKKTVGDYLVGEISDQGINYITNNSSLRDKLITSVANKGMNTIMNDPSIQKEIVSKVANEGAKAVSDNKGQIINEVSKVIEQKTGINTQSAVTQGWDWLEKMANKKKR